MRSRSTTTFPVPGHATAFSATANRVPQAPFLRILPGPAAGSPSYASASACGRRSSTTQVCIAVALEARTDDSREAVRHSGQRLPVDIMAQDIAWVGVHRNFGPTDIGAIDRTTVNALAEISMRRLFRVWV